MLEHLRFLIVAGLALAGSGVFASTSGVVISQVYGGGGNAGSALKGDFIELFNAGDAPVSLSGWSLQYASATGTSWQVTPLGNVALAPGRYYLVQQALGAGGNTDLPAPDATGSIAMSASAGKVALVSTATALGGAAPADPRIVDVVGFGNANFFETAPTAPPANASAVLRKLGGCLDADDNASDFEVSAPTPRNSSSAPNRCAAASNAPIVAVCPSFMAVAGSGGSSIATASDPDGIVEAAALGGQPAGISLVGLTPATTRGGTASVTIAVSAAQPAGAYPITLTWSNNDGQSTRCSPIVSVGAATPIPAIQGFGATSPLVGRAVSTHGVVTGLLNNGFFMQDPVGDGDPRTSDGIRVFTGTAPTVSVGDLVRVSATVAEFNTGAADNPDTRSHTVTELRGVSSVAVLGTGQVVVPVSLVLPVAARDDLEPLEGMLVSSRPAAWRT
jgi:predicted extracellular nuclease